MAIVKTDSKHYSDIAEALRTHSGAAAFKYKPAEMAQGVSLVYEYGNTKGYDEGKSDGFGVGYNTGKNEGISEGHDAGYKEGHDAGYKEGKSDGYDEGYDVGVAEGGMSVSSGTKYEYGSGSLTIPALIGKKHFTLISIANGWYIEGGEPYGLGPEHVVAVICVDGSISAVGCTASSDEDVTYDATIREITVIFDPSSGKLSGNDLLFKGSYKYTIFE